MRSLKAIAIVLIETPIEKPDRKKRTAAQGGLLDTAVA